MGSSKRSDHESTARGRSEPQNAQERQARIAAYVDGEMTPDEVAAFERRLETDEALRREVEQWREAFEAARDWMDAEAPGVERVAALKVPSVAGRRSARARPTRVLTIRSVAWRGIAAAAIFAVGVYIGQLTQPAAPTPDRDTPATTPMQQQVKSEEKGPAEGKQQALESRTIQVVDLPMQRYMDESGRLVIETTLKASGARALWVVDGGFQLAQSSVKP